MNLRMLTVRSMPIANWEQCATSQQANAFWAAEVMMNVTKPNSVMRAVYAQL